jgi:hypothetical protein
VKNIRVVLLLTCALALSGLSTGAFAHHGTNISYDHANPITFKARVTEFRFTNPHAQIFFDVIDEKGEATPWTGELTNPANMVKNGWSRARSEAALKPGTMVTITVFPSKAGTKAGVVSKILDTNGEQLLLGREQRIE